MTRKLSGAARLAKAGQLLGAAARAHARKQSKDLAISQVSAETLERLQKLEERITALESRKSLWGRIKSVAKGMFKIRKDKGVQ